MCSILRSWNGDEANNQPQDNADNADQELVLQYFHEFPPCYFAISN
jgi:hypothetical protein